MTNVKTAKLNFVPGTSRRPRRAATLLAQVADLERGDRIKQLREQRHLTQPVIADRVGVTLRAYQEWEAGGGIAWPNAKRLAKVLGTLPDYIMSGIMTRDQMATPDLFAMNGDGDRLERMEEKLDELIDLVNKLRAEAAVRDAEAQRRTEEAAKPTPGSRQPRRR